MVQLHPDFSGGKVFITDGASGIGFAIATSVCWLMLRLLLLISKKRPAAQRELESMGSAVRFLPMDVSSPASVVGTLAAAIDELGVSGASQARAGRSGCAESHWYRLQPPS